MINLAYEAVDRIRTFKREVKEILDNYEEDIIENIEKVKEDLKKKQLIEEHA